MLLIKSKLDNTLYVLINTSQWKVLIGHPNKINDNIHILIFFHMEIIRILKKLTSTQQFIPYTVDQFQV